MPSDDFWYPPYMIGRWNTSLTFSKANFTDKIPLEVLAQNNNLPGFTKYSVIFAPDMGKDVNFIMRYAQIDSHPREDHPFNLRQRVQAYLPESIIDAAPYAFQKAVNFISYPANKWTIQYHDATGNGTIQLETVKRDYQVFAGAVDSTEYFIQTHYRRSADGFNSKLISEYALNWKLYVPESQRDEFVTIDELRKSNSLVGQMNILLYLRPTSDLYFLAQGIPAGVFTYDVNMSRIPEPIAATEYPFVWDSDGPVELDKYFGY